MGEEKKTFEIENESIKEFIAKITSDEEAKARLLACKDLDEAYAFASSIQDGFTMEEFTEVAAKAYESLGAVELTDEDLNALAGGLSDAAKTTIATAVAAAISTGLAFAMA